MGAEGSPHIGGWAVRANEFLQSPQERPGSSAQKPKPKVQQGIFALTYTAYRDLPAHCRLSKGACSDSPRATPVAPSPDLLPSRSRHFREWGAKLPLNKSGARPPSTAVNLSARVSFLRVLVSLRLTLAVQIYEVCLFVPRMRARARVDRDLPPPSQLACCVLRARVDGPRVYMDCHICILCLMRIGEERDTTFLF